MQQRGKSSYCLIMLAVLMLIGIGGGDFSSYINQVSKGAF